MLAYHMVNGSTSWRTSNTATVATESPKKGAVGGAGVPSVKAVDDVKPVLDGFKWLDGVLEFEAIE